MSFLKKIIKSIFQISIPTFSFENNQLRFLINDDETFNYDLGEYDMKTRHDPYILEAYTLKNSDIHLEFVKTDANASWNGKSRSFYESLIKSSLKLKSMELLKREEIGHYEFSTYKIDDSFVIHLIYIWEVHKDVFIIDTKGKLFKTLISKYKKDYIYEYEDEEKGSVNFDISLVKNNAFNAYFNQSS